MRIARIASYVAVALLAIGMYVTPAARADLWNQKTIFTFSGPVEIPGQVLPAGTYVFKLADSMADRHIVQVFNKDENHLYGTFLAIPDYKLKPADKPILTFQERTAGAPEAVKAWFYPGENYGHDFVYPKMKAMALAKANNQPVASMPEDLNTNTTKATKNTDEPNVMAMKSAPLKAQQPSQTEVEITQAFTPPPAPTKTAPAPTQTAANNMPSELPKTASPLPLIGLVGLVSLGIAGSLASVAARKR